MCIYAYTGCKGKSTLGFSLCSYSSQTYNSIFKDVQGVLLSDRLTLRGDSRHEDKHYEIGNHGAQTSSVGARGH